MTSGSGEPGKREHALPDLDLAALTGPVDRADIDRVQRSLDHPYLGAGVVVALGLVAAVVPALILWVVSPWLALVPLAVVAGFAAALAVVTRRSAHRHAEARLRLAGFAADNAMTWTPELVAPQRPGAIFDVGILRRAEDVVTMSEPRQAELATYSYAAGYRNAELVRWGYATTALAVAPAPHVLLVSRVPHRAGRPPFPGARTPGGVLDLPGLDQAFEVRGPVGRAADVGRLMAPLLPLCDRLIDPVRPPIHIEVVDARLYLYSPEPLVSTDPGRWRWILPLLVDVAEAFEGAAITDEPK
jgi:hypothetical protein